MDLTIHLYSLLGASFPPNFPDVVKTIFKRLFRVYAHIYHSHFQKIVNLKEEAHLNTCFKHFVLFTWVSFFFFCWQQWAIHFHSVASKSLFAYHFSSFFFFYFFHSSSCQIESCITSVWILNLAYLGFGLKMSQIWVLGFFYI